MTMNSVDVPAQRQIILGSSSPYRKALLEKLRLPFTQASPDVDETPLPGESVEQLVLRLSLTKAKALSDRFRNHLIIGSDQAALHGTTRLGKPGDRDRAIEQLHRVAGGCVRFFTGVCVLDSASHRHFSEIDTCTVHFRSLSTRQIERYVDADRPWSCAGGFKAESLGIALFERIDGDDPNALVGLPLIRLVRILEAFGLAVI